MMQSFVNVALQAAARKRNWKFDDILASRYLRLHPTETRIYRTPTKWMASVPAANKGMIEVVCSGDDEIIRLIDRGYLFLI